MRDGKAIRYLSLAAKAGRLITGWDDCVKAIEKQRKHGLIVLACDAGENTVRRAGNLAKRPGVSVTKSPYTKTELAAAVGRGSSAALALVTDEGLAAAYTAASANGLEQEERI